MHWTTRLATLCCFALSAPLLAAEPDDSQTEASKAAAVKIGELNEAYVTAFNKQDADQLKTCFRTKGEFTLLTGDTVSGRTQITAAHRSFFSYNPDAKISGKQETLRFLRPGMAIATGSWQVKEGPKEYPSAGKWSTILTRSADTWKYEVMRLMVPAQPAPNR